MMAAEMIMANEEKIKALEEAGGGGGGGGGGDDALEELKM